MTVMLILILIIFGPASLLPLLLASDPDARECALRRS